MKVLLINGSPRQNGNTYTALSEIAKTLQTEGIDSEIVWIGNKPVRGCIACGTCKTKGNGRCVFDDDVCNAISAKFAEADGFVFGSPGLLWSAQRSSACYHAARFLLEWSEPAE